MISVEVFGHTVPHWKALRYGKDGSKGLSCGSTSSICEDFLKSDNLLHKQGLVDSQLKTTVTKQENDTLINKRSGNCPYLKTMSRGIRLFRISISNALCNCSQIQLQNCPKIVFNTQIELAYGF